MMTPIALVVGFLLGLAIPRFWVSPVLAAGVTVYAGVSFEIEVSSWFVGGGLGLLSGLAHMLGVATRRWMSRKHRVR